MADKTPTLAELRTRIDEIDNELARLIDARCEATHQVTLAKRAEGAGGFGLRPARESQIMRRLLALPRRAASKALIVRLWREIMGDSLYNQGSFHLTVWGRDKAKMAELARMRFSGAPWLDHADEPEHALARVRGGNAIAVMQLSRENPWFGRLLVEPKLSAFAVLPCLTQWGSPQALAIAEVPPEPSGDGDETLWVTDSQKSNYEIEEAFSNDGVAARIIMDAGGLKLFGLAGFFEANDERLARGPGRMTGRIGVAAAPFDY